MDENTILLYLCSGFSFTILFLVISLYLVDVSVGEKHVHLLTVYWVCNREYFNEPSD